MSEEEKKEKCQKTKITLPFLLVILSCLCFILSSLPLWNPIPDSPEFYYRHRCQSNLKELAFAMLFYVDDYDGMLPIPSKWCDLLIEGGYAKKKEFTCPGADSGLCNYAMNRNLENIGSLYKIKASPDIVCLFETYPGWNQVGDSGILTTANHKDKGCHVSFLDGHVAFVTKQDLRKLKWKPDEVQQK